MKIKLIALISIFIGDFAFAVSTPIENFPLNQRNTVENARYVTDFLNNLEFTTENVGRGNPFIEATSSHRYPSQRDVELLVFKMHQISRASFIINIAPLVQLEILEIQKALRDADIRRRNAQSKAFVHFDPTSPFHPLYALLDHEIVQIVDHLRPVEFGVQIRMIQHIEEFTNKDDRDAYGAKLIGLFGDLAKTKRIDKKIKVVAARTIKNPAVLERLRTTIYEAVNPVIPTVTTPVSAAHELQDFWKSWETHCEDRL